MKNKDQRAFSLIEIMFAFAIFTFVLVTLTGLLSVGIKTNQETKEETEAVNLLAAVIQDMRHTPRNAVKSEIFDLSPAPYDSGASVGTVNEAWFDEGWNLQRGKKAEMTARFKVEWWYVRIPEKKSLSVIEAVFRVSWPPRDQKTFGSGKDTKGLDKMEIYASFLNQR